MISLRPRLSERGRSRSIWSTGAFAVGLAWVVAIAAADAPLLGELRSGTGQTREILSVIGFVAAITAAAALIAGRLIGRVRQFSDRGAPEWLIPFGAVCFSLFSLVAIDAIPLVRGARDTIFVELQGQDRRSGTIVDEREGLRAGEDQREDPPSDLNPAEHPQAARTLVVTVLIAALLALLLYARRRRSAAESELQEFELEAAAIHELLIDTIARMLADPDPRTAIIGAYASLLHGLSARGLPRAAHEGSTEYLRRVLRNLQVRPEPLRRLTDLFEFAKFSAHALTPDHRDAALAALRTAARDLATAQPGRIVSTSAAAQRSW